MQTTLGLSLSPFPPPHLNLLPSGTRNESLGAACPGWPWWAHQPCPAPFPAGSLMAAMNQQPVDLSKAFLHFNPIDRDYCLEQELRGEPCQQQILITDNIDGAFT